MTVMLELNNVSKSFVKKTGQGIVRINAVDNVSLSVTEQSNVGIIGESGSGKTTLGRIMTKLTEPDSGLITYRSVNVTGKKRKKLSEFRREVQMIFQDPYSSLDPRMSVRAAIADFMKLGGNEPDQEHISRYLSMVNLDDDILDKRPRDISGGQRQRVAVARVLALNPRIIVADEPVSALDVSIRSQVLTMFQDIRRRAGITFVYITHDISTLPYVAEQMHVMYRGRIVESCDIRSLISEPLHPYTMGLLAAVPDFNKDTADISRHIKSTSDVDMVPEHGCSFYYRCAHALPVCKDVDPPLAEQEKGRLVACHLYGSREASNGEEADDHFRNVAKK